VFVTYPPYIREKARSLRSEKRLSIDEIAERLALPKTTIYHWVRDLPLARPRRENARVAGEVTRAKHAALREAAYQRGLLEWQELSGDPTFRDFVTLYIAEGYKRNRNCFSVANSDAAVIVICARWIRRLTSKKMTPSVQYHADQDLERLRQFWGSILAHDPGDIRLQRKSNSNQLSGRSWRSEYGVLTLTVHDTYLRARMQAWMDSIRASWV
jgi:AcrR family transcriptional regulator